MPRPLFQIVNDSESESEYEGDPMDYDPLERAKFQFFEHIRNSKRPPSPLSEFDSDAIEDDSDKAYKNVVVKRIVPFPKRHHPTFYLPWRYKQNQPSTSNKK